MRIEVAIAGSQSAKRKGDLLEALAEDLLRIRGYSVTTEVRRTGSELDLLCKNKVNGRIIYVECKAQRELLSANILKNLLGTVTLSDYSEGWLIAASPLGKEAKGIQFEWEKKPQEQRERLSIYTPEQVIDALIDSNLITHPPENAGLPRVDTGVSVGDWTLLVTEHGRFWVQTVLMSGVPAAVQVFTAEQSALVSDPLLLRRLAETDSTLSTLDFEFRSSRGRAESYRIDEDQHPVVQVEHGQSWSDYRPSRPEDFVGRKPAQDNILKFLDAVRTETTTTRVFAITGDSGMGKSSLIAKLRNRTRNIRYRKKFSMYAVDVRAAVKPSYVLWSLLACLRDTIESGFIELDGSALEISDHADPLASQSIQRVLEVLQQQRRIVCLVFDQFEELYSKPEMFSIYEAAQQLFLSAASAQSNLVLGFAWRADSTVQQDHPAYHMWHGLKDHRFEVAIGPFSHSEASEAITIFQGELGEKLLPGIRRQIAENSQGYPWLLKKLCIHLYGQLRAGESQAKLVDTLDVERLFAEDLKALSQPEDYCLRLIAAQAPADWHEVLEAVGADTLRGLQDKRLIVRSGNRINLYWDLFREYVLTGQAPSVPFTYVASSSVRAVLAVAQELCHENGKSFEELSEAVGRKASTVQNIVHDLVMFRVVQVSSSKATLDPDIASADGYSILERIRHILKRHALYLVLSAADSDSNVFALEDVIECLQRTNPTARHGSATWKAYAERILQWLCAAGLLDSVHNGWVRHDRGKPVPLADARRLGKGTSAGRRGFQAEAPPERVMECLQWAREAERDASAVRDAGYRNAMSVLVRFGLVQRDSGEVHVPTETGNDGNSSEAVWKAAWRDPTLRTVVELLQKEPAVAPKVVAERVEAAEQRNWSGGSKLRIGNGLRRWARWLTEGREADPPPVVPRRQHGKPRKVEGERQQGLWDS